MCDEKYVIETNLFGIRFYACESSDNWKSYTVTVSREFARIFTKEEIEKYFRNSSDTIVELT